MLFDTRKLKYAILKQFENKCIHILRKRLHIKISSVQQNYDRIPVSYTHLTLPTKLSV